MWWFSKYAHHNAEAGDDNIERPSDKRKRTRCRSQTFVENFYQDFFIINFQVLLLRDRRQLYVYACTWNFKIEGWTFCLTCTQHQEWRRRWSSATRECETQGPLADGVNDIMLFKHQPCFTISSIRGVSWPSLDQPVCISSLLSTV